MKSFKLFFFCCFFVRLCIAQTEVPQLYTLEDKIYTLHQLAKEVEYNFVHIDQLDFSPDSLFKVTLQKVLTTTNDIEYFDEIQKYLASFNDGHTQLLRRTYQWGEYFDYMPIGIQEIDQKFYISAIPKNLEIDSTFIGAEIIEAEGVNTVEYVKSNIFPFISASTLSHKFYQSAPRLAQGLANTDFHFKVKKRDQEIVDMVLTRNGERTRTDDDDYWSFKGLMDSGRNERIRLYWEEDDIAVLDIRAFSPDNIMEKIDSMALLINEKAKGLIIDLRFNGGGSTTVAVHLQKYLSATPSFLRFGSQTRLHNAYGKAQGNYREEYEDHYLGRAYLTKDPDTVYVGEQISPFTCPVVILIGKFTFSAAEDFLVNIWECENRPLIIGEETGGSTGAPLVIYLPHGAVARVCTLRVLYPYSRTPFVGKGIIPDIPVQNTIEDWIEGRDRVFESAIEKIKTIY